MNLSRHFSVHAGKLSTQAVDTDYSEGPAMAALEETEFCNQGLIKLRRPFSSKPGLSKQALQLSPANALLPLNPKP